jgi:hypothetical protein
MAVPLKPQQSFTVVRQIANHLDSATYYVRAVIRNAHTDDLIDTLNLEDRGGQRFTRNWRVPADRSGQGFYISIVTSVFSDAGYTTKSENYGDEENTHLVSDVFANQSRGGGGGWLDAATLRKIMREEIQKAKPEPTKPTEPVNLNPLLQAIERVSDAVSAIPTEKSTPVDLSPVTEAMETLRSAIAEKEVTQPTDLSPVLAKFEEIAPVIEAGIRNLTAIVDDNQDRLTNDVVKEIAEIFKGTTFSIAPSTATLDVGKPQKPKEEAETLDLDALAS